MSGSSFCKCTVTYINRGESHEKVRKPELYVSDILGSIAFSTSGLRQAEEIQVKLIHLRDLCKNEQFAEDQQAQAFLAEAEKLIIGEQYK